MKRILIFNIIKRSVRDKKLSISIYIDYVIDHMGKIEAD